MRCLQLAGSQDLVYPPNFRIPGPRQFVNGIPRLPGVGKHRHPRSPPRGRVIRGSPGSGTGQHSVLRPATPCGLGLPHRRCYPKKGNCLHNSEGSRLFPRMEPGQLRCGTVLRRRTTRTVHRISILLALRLHVPTVPFHLENHLIKRPPSNCDPRQPDRRCQVPT